MKKSHPKPYLYLGKLILILGGVLTTANAGPFPSMFSIPREPETQLGPSQYYELDVPKGKGVVITDIYIKNLSANSTHIEILEQIGPVSYEKLYRYDVEAGQTLNINLTTGLKLFEQGAGASADYNSLRVVNGGSGDESDPGVLTRINGYFSPIK